MRVHEISELPMSVSVASLQIPPTPPPAPPVIGINRTVSEIKVPDPSFRRVTNLWELEE